MSWMVIGFAVIYILGGQRMAWKAYQHVRPEYRGSLQPSLLSPEHFTAEGEVLRKRALRYWYLGALVVGLLVLAVWLHQ